MELLLWALKLCGLLWLVTVGYVSLGMFWWGRMQHRAKEQFNALVGALNQAQIDNAMHEIVRASIPALVADNEAKDARIAELETRLSSVFEIHEMLVEEREAQ